MKVLLASFLFSEIIALLPVGEEIERGGEFVQNAAKNIR